MIQFSGIQDAEAFNLINQTKNPPISDNTNAIWIFSARHDINQAHVNCNVNPVNFQSLASAQSIDQCDIKDDYLRIKAGLELGAKLTAKRAGKSVASLCPEDYELHAPWIIYNGSPVQNKAFHEALQNGLSTLSLPDYAAAKVVILPLAQDKMHTGGQFDGLAEQIKVDSRLQPLEGDGADVLCISSAFHLRRIQRLFNSKKFSCPFSPNANITLWGIDRNFQRPCAPEDVEGELKRITRYFETGDIGEPKVEKVNWYALPSLRRWTPLQDANKLNQVEINNKILTPVPLTRRHSF